MSEYEITIELENGETETIEAPADEYILDAAEDAGLELPYSCREGNCTSCTGMVLDGEVERGGVALDLDEEAEGYALLCCSYARSDCRIEAGVQDELFGGFGDLDV